jgi:hypothetical protein
MSDPCTEHADASRFVYARRSLIRDYARGIAGVLMCVALIFIANPTGVVLWVLAGVAALFAWFIVAVALKQATLITADDCAVVSRVRPGLKLGPLTHLIERRIAFAELQRFHLRVFGRRRSRGKGVVELTLKTPQARLVVEGSLEGFDRLTELSAAAATRRGLRLDDATRANLTALGHAADTLTEA